MSRRWQGFFWMGVGLLLAVGCASAPRDREEPGGRPKSGAAADVAMMPKVTDTVLEAEGSPFGQTFQSMAEAKAAMMKVEPHAPRVGDPAPDFTLSDPTGAASVTLSHLREKAPVVLLFGSYT